MLILTRNPGEKRNFDMSSQNEIAKLVFDYLSETFAGSKKLEVVCDQGSAWGAKKNSSARKKISLYTDTGRTKGRNSQMSQADLAVIDNEQKVVPYLIEIETGKHIKPKTAAGIIGATNMCKWHYPSGEYDNRFNLSGVVLFVLLCSESFTNPLSKKSAQLEEFKDKYENSHGCIRESIICCGHDVQSTFNAFRTEFEKAGSNTHTHKKTRRKH